MSRAYYNEFEPYAAEWLRNLIKRGIIADGEVDSRSIVDVQPDDIRGFDQCHFFAGIGVWSYALRLAGWPDDRPVWTGSCPCQPFSDAGKKEGFDDHRHLWPEFYRLIRECRPPVVFGEQVASKDGLAWLDTVQSDMEASGYAIGAADLCAAGIGAPHIRQRLWFVGERLDDTAGARHVGQIAGAEGEARDEARLRLPGQGRGVDRLADADSEDQRGRGIQRPKQGNGPSNGTARERLAGLRADGGLGHDHHQRPEGQRSGHQAEGGWNGAAGPVAAPGEPRGLADAEHDDGRADEPGRRQEGRAADGWHGAVGGVADANGRHPSAEREQRGGQQRQQSDDSGALHCGRPRPTNGHWRDADWLHCRDGRWRPVEPGTFPLVNGIAFKLGSGSTLEGRSRLGMLRAYGNAIVGPVAAEFIAAAMECLP